MAKICGRKKHAAKGSVTVKFILKTIIFCFGIGLACLSTLAMAAPGAADDRITLIEHLNRGWTNEWVAYPFSAKNGDCAVGSVQLTLSLIHI